MDKVILQHFRRDEEETVKKIADYISKAENEYRPVLTHFLNPRERRIAEFLIKKNSGIKISAYGGSESAERKRVLFYPEYYDASDDDFNIALLNLEYPVKFSRLSHGNILGTLANSGVDREVLGDIINHGNEWQVVCEQEIKRFFISQINKIGKTKVEFHETDFANLLHPEIEWLDNELPVSSLRLDSLISSIYNISRGNTKNLIKAKKVQLNWMICEKPDWDIKIDDVISIRGYGRFKLEDILNITKKGKTRIKVKVLKK